MLPCTPQISRHKMPVPARVAVEPDPVPVPVLVPEEPEPPLKVPVRSDPYPEVVLRRVVIGLIPAGRVTEFREHLRDDPQHIPIRDPGGVLPPERPVGDLSDEVQMSAPEKRDLRGVPDETRIVRHVSPDLRTI